MITRIAQGNKDIEDIISLVIEISIRELQTLFAVIWNREDLPDDWTEGILIKIPEKGALSNCNNLWEITLLSIPSELLANVIIHRISEAVDQELWKEHTGFRKGGGVHWPSTRSDVY